MSELDPTHCLQINGSSIDEILPILDPEGTVKRAPSRLDGSATFAVSLWRLPQGMRLWDELPGAWPFEFLQAAGSKESMMVEISQEDDSGELHLYRLARPGDSSNRELVDLKWRDRVEQVSLAQVFNAGEAAEIFWHYYCHGEVPSSYLLEELQ